MNSIPNSLRSGPDERGQFGQRVFRVFDAALGPDAGQHHPFQPQLAVFDLGDVGEFGGEPGHSPE